MRTYQDSKRTLNSASLAELWSRVPGVSAVSALWQRLASYLLQNSNLRIWQSHDASGKVRWNVFDIRTNRSATLLSEDDVRVWIEEGYDYVQPKTWFLQHPSDSWIYQSDR
jgi:hypothetical protein